jgi:tripartite-type tricarboxylate transporter receptor subunit TctC
MDTRRLLVAATALVSLNAWGADYPERAIRIIVPFAAGSGTDIVARATGAALAKRMGVAVTVENVTGSGGAKGTVAVAKAAPDGYTLLATSSRFTIRPHLDNSAGYDPLNDFVAVAQVAVVPLVMVTSGKSRFKTFDDLVAEMRTSPGTVRYATSGRGSLSHLEAALMNQHLKAQAQANTYKSDQQALGAIAGGQADFYLATLPMALAQINKGSLRALAVSTSARIERLPNVPTLSEALKRPGYAPSLWYGVVAPKGTPVPVITRLENEIERELEVAGVAARIETVGARVTFLRSAPFGGQIGFDFRKWGEVGARRAPPRVAPRPPV